MELREDALLERFEHAGVAEKRGLLREQRFQEFLKLEIGFADGAKQIRPASMAFARHVLTHTRGKEPLPRFVEPDACSLLNQHADFAQFVFGQTHLGRPCARLAVLKSPITSGSKPQLARAENIIGASDAQRRAGTGTCRSSACSIRCAGAAPEAFWAARNCESASLS